MNVLENKIRDILIYIVAMERLSKKWFYRLYFFRAYASELIAALAAVGISHPLIKTFQENKGSSDQIKSSFENNQVFWIIGVVAAVLWIFLRAIITIEGVEKKTILARSYKAQMKAIEGNLYKNVGFTDPINNLNALYNLASELFDKATQDGIPELTDIAFHDRKTAAIVNERLSKIINDNNNRWTNNENNNRRMN